MPLTFAGSFQSLMVRIFSSSILSPCGDMTYPRYSVSFVWNSHLDAFSVSPVSRTHGSIARTCSRCVSSSGEKTRMSSRYATQKMSR